MDSAGVSWSGLECVSERACGYHDGVPQGMCDLKFVLTRSTAEGVGGFVLSQSLLSANILFNGFENGANLSYGEDIMQLKVSCMLSPETHAAHGLCSTWPEGWSPLDSFAEGRALIRRPLQRSSV